jgi:hypothetical protein
MMWAGWLAGLAGTAEIRLGGSGFPGPTLLELCCLFLLPISQDKQATAPYPRGMLVLMGYLAWICAAGLASSGQGMEALRAARDVTGAGLCTLVMARWVIRGGSWQSLALGALTGALLQAGLGISQFTLDGPFLQPVSENLAAKTDFSGELMAHFAVGLFNHPNGLALLLLPATVGLGGLALHPASRSLAVLAILLVLAALWCTAAKGVMIWAGLGLLLCLLGPFWRVGPAWSRHLPMTLMLLLDMAILFYAVWPDAEGHIEAPTVLTRVNMWLAGAAALGTDPMAWLMGKPSSDMESWTLLLSRVSYANCHSTWWNQILYYGIPGFVGYLAVTGTGASALWRLCRGPGSPLGPATGMAMLLAVVGEAIFEPAGAGVSSPFVWLALSILPQVLATQVEHESKNRKTTG